MSNRTGFILATALAGACAPAAPDEQAPGPDEPGAEASEEVRAPEVPGGATDAYVRPAAEGGALVQGDTVPGLPSWTRQDREVLRATVTWAWENGVDRLTVGERVARIGETFVGAPYIPQTLDPSGPERLVINLRAYDCVTYIENILALAHFVREEPRDILDRPEDAMRRYAERIMRIRYRDGRLAGYPSRLHYFSEWLADNERKGVLQLVTSELGGVVDPEPITFMTAHRDAYKQLADASVYAEIGRIERRLNEVPRHYLPERRVAAVAERIQTGDVIAATSTLDGLDIAHTGIALWKDGTLHLMHAPLVGKDVQISELPLAERILDIKSQDGIMVARPLEAR